MVSVQVEYSVTGWLVVDGKGSDDCWRKLLEKRCRYRTEP